MANAISARVHTAATWSVALSVLMIAAGLLAIAAPLVAGVAVATLVAWVLVFSGVLHLAFGWRRAAHGGVGVGSERRDVGVGGDARDLHCHELGLPRHASRGVGHVPSRHDRVAGGR